MEKASKPKYGAMSNIFFTMKNIVRIDKLLLVSMIALVFCMVAQPVVSVYMPKFIIQFFEDGRKETDLLLLVLALGAVSLLLGQLRSFADGYFPRMKSMFRSMRLGSEMCVAAMEVDYQYLSSEKGQLETRKAQHAINNVTNAIMRFYSAISGLIQQYTMFKVASEYFDLSIRYFALPETGTGGTRRITLTPDADYTFAFCDVSFRYPGADALALEHINLTIKKGERLAVVGMNGAGKTTLIKLLCRFYQPDEGKITLNGVDIAEYDNADYTRLFSVVFQDFKLFSFPLDQNIAASEDVDVDRMEQHLKSAGLNELVEELKGDYRVAIGKQTDENGRDFSGGEQQKLAIARALYKDAPIIVLDEPTAALDPITEFEIYSKFNELVGEKACVFISHRLSSCRFCHNIAVFDGGEIVQLGNHNELLAKKDGKYYELWNAQAKHYVEEEQAE